MSDSNPAEGGWWVIHEDDIVAALEAVSEGTDPGLVFAELYANTNSGVGGVPPDDET